MSAMHAPEALPHAPIDDAVAAAERARCAALLRDRARAFERKKLFPVARALTSVADEIGGDLGGLPCQP